MRAASRPRVDELETTSTPGSEPRTSTARRRPSAGSVPTTTSGSASAPNATATLRPVTLQPPPSRPMAVVLSDGGRPNPS